MAAHSTVYLHQWTEKLDSILELPGYKRFSLAL